jgi:hypothetical protein
MELAVRNLGKAYGGRMVLAGVAAKTVQRKPLSNPASKIRQAEFATLLSGLRTCTQSLR